MIRTTTLLSGGLTLLFCCCSFLLIAQGSISGSISSDEGPVAFANVGLENGKRGTSSDFDGNFELKEVAVGKHTLTISAVGFETLTRDVELKDSQHLQLEFSLKSSVSQLEEVVVTGTLKETFLRESPVKVEVLTPAFFKTSPSSNVVEALQSVNGVQEQVGCGVCGTNDIHINGMEGPYTLVMIDGMPIVSALSSVYGFNGIPTQLVERVEIVKGPASSLYGTEAVGGVINIITKSPSKTPLLSLNTFYTSHNEANLDIATSLKVGSKMRTLLSGNYFRNTERIDKNNDNFTDIPLNTRISIFNKWSLERKEKRVFNLAARYYYEDRFGGVLDWEPEFRGKDTVYGESIYTNRVEVIGTYQLPISSEHFRVDYSFNYHDQNSVYGSTPYIADQSVLFANFIWDKKIGKNDLLVGGTYRRQTYNDNTPATPDGDAKTIPGIFLQDEYKWSDKWSFLGGLRLDHHEDHDFVFTPRMAIKFRPSTWTTFRLNAGEGFRTVNLFTEDHAALTGSRKVEIADELAPEQSYNVNLNANHVFQSRLGSGSVDVDVFYNYFSNKIVPDYDTDQNRIIYGNLDGHGVVQGAALALDHTFTFPLKTKLGITYQDVYNVEKTEQGEEVRANQEFAPRWSGTFVIGYHFRRWGLNADYTGKIVGPQDLPIYDAPFNRDEVSPWYSIQNVQLTKSVWKHVEIYGGVKNLLNWTQESPLIDPEHPFGDAFDTAYAYGPLQTRRYFLGFRWRLP